MPQPKIKNTSWNLGLLFKGDNDPAIDKLKQETEEHSYAFINKWKERSDYLSDSKVLKEALDEYEAWIRNYGPGSRIGYYFQLREAIDQNDPKLKAKHKLISDWQNKVLNDIRFFLLKVAKVDLASQQKFLADQNLLPYHHFLEQMFKESKYLLTENEEKILALKEDPAHNDWLRLTSSFIAKEERPVKIKGKIELKPMSELASLSSHQNKSIRDQAAAGFNDIVNKYADTAEAEINAILANKKIDDELRGFARPDSARQLADEVEASTVDTMIQAVGEHNKLAQDFYKLKAKLLGVERLAYHERNVPVGKLDIEMDYPAAVLLVRTVFEKLDPKFSQILEQYVEQGQIDVYPQKGKLSGAFCASEGISLPTYIMLNYSGRLSDTRTIAHELGHGINNEFMRQKQNALYYSMPMATAEVPSTFMEDFVLEELAQDADDKKKLSLLMSKLNSDVSSIFRQAACYRFEQELHQEYRVQGYLSKDDIGKIFQKHMKSYMGPAVEQSTGSQYWWVYWQHIRDFFYVYSYASGLLISKALQAMVKRDPSGINKVKEFFAAGSSDTPKNIFLKLGIDIDDKNFWEQGIAEVAASLKEAERLARKLNYQL